MAKSHKASRASEPASEPAAECFHSGLRDGDDAAPGRRMTSTRAAIGAEMLAIRRKLSLSQVEFAKKVGLSAGMVSKIEHGTVAASIEILAAITKNLGVSFAGLFAGLEEVGPCFHVPSGKGLCVVREGSEHNFLHDLKGHWFSEYGLSEFYFVTAEKDASPFFCRSTGLAFLYMLSGKIRYRHGERIFILEPGDTLYFDATSLHGPDMILDYPVSYLLWRQTLSGSVQQQPFNRKPVSEPLPFEQSTNARATGARPLSKRQRSQRRAAR